MRHRKGNAKLARPTDQRMQIIRSIATGLLRCGKIETLERRARQAERLAEKVIALAKRGDLSARRQAIALVGDKEVIKKVFADAAEKYKAHIGGVVRLTKIGYRRGDNSPKVIMELISETKD